MKLLEAIENVKVYNKEMLIDIYYALEDRMNVLEMQEPDCDKEFFYEKWENKYNDFCVIFEDFEVLMERLGFLETEIEEELLENDIKILENSLNKIKIDIKNYQFEYGGLKRLKI